MNNNQKDIMVSVYCLAYNHEKYIRETLDGFVSQITDFNFEVWVHDDASTDHTPDIIQEYVDKYPTIIKPIYQKENQYSKGLGITRTYIYPKMQGRYIASCEGDDYWNDPYKLQKQFNAMEAHPECSLSTHKVQCCNEDGTPNEHVIPEKFYCIHGTKVIKERDLARYYYILCGHPFQTSSYFYRREILDIDLNYPYSMGVVRKCLTLGCVYYFDEPMSTYRLWAIGSWTSRMKEGGVQASWNQVNKFIAFENTYDRYSGHMYHDYIGGYMLLKILPFVEYPKYRCEVKKLIQKYDLNPWKARKVLTVSELFRLEVRYVLAMYLPSCYAGAKKIWQLATGRNQK